MKLSLNQYELSIVKITKGHVFFNLIVNNYLANTDGYICLSKEDFEQLYRDLFRSSRGHCVKSFSTNPPTEFYF